MRDKNKRTGIVELPNRYPLMNIYRLGQSQRFWMPNYDRLYLRTWIDLKETVHAELSSGPNQSDSPEWRKDFRTALRNIPVSIPYGLQDAFSPGDQTVTSGGTLEFHATYILWTQIDGLSVHQPLKLAVWWSGPLEEMGMSVRISRKTIKQLKGHSPYLCTGASGYLHCSRRVLYAHLLWTCQPKSDAGARDWLHNPRNARCRDLCDSWDTGAGAQRGLQTFLLVRPAQRID